MKKCSSGRVGVWVGIKHVLRIAYSNLKLLGDPKAAATPAADPHATKSLFSAS